MRTDAGLERGGQEVWSFTKLCKFIPGTKHRSGKNKRVKLVHLVFMDEQVGGIRGSEYTWQYICSHNKAEYK